MHLSCTVTEVRGPKDIEVTTIGLGICGFLLVVHWNHAFILHRYGDMIRNVYGFKKRLVKSGLVWSITLLILLSMNGEIVSMFVIAQLANISISFIAGS